MSNRLLSDTKVDAAIEKNNHVTIVAFLLELGTTTGVDNCGAFTDNALGKSGVDVKGGGRGPLGSPLMLRFSGGSKGVRLSLRFPG